MAGATAGACGGGVGAGFGAARGSGGPRYPLFVRLPSFTELRGWLLDAGFSRVDGFGEDGEPLHQDHRRMVVVAHA